MLRIAFDMDGVFADMQRGLAREAEALFGKAAVADVTAASAQRLDSAPLDEGDAEDSAPAPAVATAAAEADAAQEAAAAVRLRAMAQTRRREQALWRKTRDMENFWEGLDEIEPGSVARLAQVAGERGWEVLFLTRRPPTKGATSQVQTQRWLARHGFALPSMFVVSGSRGRIAESLDLDVVVDDRPENCLDVAVESKARAILIWRDDAGAIPASAKRLGIAVVRSVRDCLDLLEQAGSTARPAGFRERLKRLLGFESSSARPATSGS